MALPQLLWKKHGGLRLYAHGVDQPRPLRPVWAEQRNAVVLSSRRLIGGPYAARCRAGLSGRRYGLIRRKYFALGFIFHHCGGSFPIRTRFAGLRTGPLLPPSQHPSLLNDQTQGKRGPKWSPVKRVHLGEEEQGSAPIFRRQAEIEGSGLCDDDGPPYWKYPPGLFYSRVCKHRRLTPSRRRRRGAAAPPQQWDPWPNSKAFSPDKTVPPSIQGRHALTPCLVHKPGGVEVGPKLFPVSPTDGRGREWSPSVA